MEKEKISELDQVLLTYAIDLLNNKYHDVNELVKFWKLFGPCLERVPKPEVYRPWMSGLGLTQGDSS